MRGFESHPIDQALYFGFWILEFGFPESEHSHLSSLAIQNPKSSWRCSSVGKSKGLINLGSEVRILPPQPLVQTTRRGRDAATRRTPHRVTVSLPLRVAKHGPNPGTITLLETKRITPISCRPHQKLDEVWRMRDEILFILHPSAFILQNRRNHAIQETKY